MSSEDNILQLVELINIRIAPAKKTFLQRQRNTTDAQIDTLVCKWYGLADDKIRFVEGDELPIYSTKMSRIIIGEKLPLIPQSRDQGLNFQ
jgi:hypothetical protein